MPRFFADNMEFDGGMFVISGDDARHISRSLRMKTGERIDVVRLGKEYLCEITGITDSEVYAKVISEKNSNEPTIEVSLFQALPKQDKLESIIQKSVELGVHEIIPVLTKRCVARPDNERFGKKSERLRKISEAAAKQSGRGIIPEISGIIGFEECLERLGECDLGLICYEKEGGVSLTEIDFSGVRTVGVLVGPEGGFEPDEAKAAIEHGAKQIWLGPRILRCETAPIAALAVIMALSGNM